MKRIKRFGVLQTAKVISILYAIGTAIFFVPLGLAVLVARNSPALSAAVQRNLGSSSPAFIILLPLVYGAFGFIAAAVSCLIYNFISDKIGGIEIELDNESGS